MSLDATLNYIDGENRLIVVNPSGLHPNHEFSLGKFSSKYTPDGFNTVLDHLIGENLLSIFGLPTPNNQATINWTYAKNKIVEVRAKIESYLEDTGGFHRVASFIHRNGEEINSHTAALRLFRQEMSQYRKDPDPELGNYSTEKGEFMFAKPWKVLAVIPGANEGGQSKQPCTFVVYEEDVLWYSEAIDVIEETIDFVLSQTELEQKKYHISWSG